MLRYILYPSIIALGFGLYLATTDPLMLMAIVFMPHLSIGIPLLVAILIAIGCRFESELKRLWKWYGLTLVGLVAGIFCAAPVDWVLRNLPEHEEASYRIVLEVDAPDGVLTSEARYRVFSNQLEINGYRKGGKRLEGSGAFIALGDGKTLSFSIPTKERPYDYHRNVLRWAKREQKRYVERAELTGVFCPRLIASKDDSTEIILPQNIPEFFGPGFQFRRAWLELTD